MDIGIGLLDFSVSFRPSISVPKVRSLKGGCKVFDIPVNATGFLQDATNVRYEKMGMVSILPTMENVLGETKDERGSREGVDML